MDTFVATFGENWATFYSNIWSHWSVGVELTEFFLNLKRNVGMLKNIQAALAVQTLEGKIGN